MRSYAPQLVKAYSLASSLFSPIVLDEELKLARDYDAEKSNQAVILVHKETKTVLRIPYFMRLKCEYGKVLRKRVFQRVFPHISQFRDFLFVTLDASTNNYYSQADAHAKVQRAWNSLLTRIRKKYPWVKVVKSVEWQSNGLGCHIHALICGLRFLPKEWVRKTWDKLEKSGWSIQIEKVFDDPKRALNYILKYVSKTLRKDDELPVSLVVNWSLGLRSVSFSRFSSNKNNSNGFGGSDWLFLGVMPLDLAFNCTDLEVLAYFGYG